MMPVTEPELFERVMSLPRDIVEDHFDLKLDWLVSKEWVAVPVDSGMHFDENDIERLSQAAISIGCSQCFAIATEPLGELPRCYQLETTPDDLLAFNRKWGAFNFVLIPETRVFAVLCTSEDYFIVAGTCEFVKKAVGRDISVARAEFEEYASDETWPEDVRELLVSVSERYR